MTSLGKLWAVFTQIWQYVMHIVDEILKGQANAQLHRLAHNDLIYKLHRLWNPVLRRICKVKSHRTLSDATSKKDLETILGKPVADETAKFISKQDFPMLQGAADATFAHSQNQLHCLHLVYKYLVDLTDYPQNLSWNEN